MRRLTTIMLALGLPLAGCGGSEEKTSGESKDDPRAAPAKVVRDFASATLDKDAAAYCELLTGDAKRGIATELAALAGDVDCEKAAAKAFDLAGQDDLDRVRRTQHELTERDVRVTGNRATATLPSGRRILLEKSGDRWLVSDPSPE